MQPETPETIATSSIDEQIMTEADFYEQYEYDHKIAADAVENPETGEITITPNPVASGAVAELTDAEALENTRILMDMRESGQAFGLAYYVEGSVNSWEKFLYSQPQKNNLIRAWSKIIAKNNISVSPWFDVIQAELFATGPLVATAISARNERLAHERTKEELRKSQAKKEEYERQARSAEPTRRDTLKQWEVDDNGCFTHTVTNPYIKIDKRAEKPRLTKENYEMLIKHNGKEKIDRVFKMT